MSKAFYGLGNRVQSGDGRAEGEKVYGVHIGIVTNNKHPDGYYRVKVKLPYFYEQDESWWCRIMTNLAGLDRGMYLLPEEDDEVLVGFLNGDPNYPVVLGCLWNGVDKFPQTLNITPADVELKIPNVDQGGKNNYRFFRSRAGHKLVFVDEEGKLRIALRSQAGNELVLDDEDGKEKIQLYDKDRKQWLEIDVPNKKITLQTDTGDILIKAKKKITMECEDFILKAKKTVSVESGKDTSHKSGANMQIEASQGMNIKAGQNMVQKASKIMLN